MRIGLTRMVIFANELGIKSHHEYMVVAYGSAEMILNSQSSIRSARFPELDLELWISVLSGLRKREATDASQSENNFFPSLLGCKLEARKLKVADLRFNFSLDLRESRKEAERFD